MGRLPVHGLDNHLQVALSRGAPADILFGDVKGSLNVAVPTFSSSEFLPGDGRSHLGFMTATNTKQPLTYSISMGPSPKMIISYSSCGLERALHNGTLGLAKDFHPCCC